MQSRSLLCILLVVMAAAGLKADTTRIACVGNSITYGFYPSTEHRDTGAYPALLMKALRVYYMTQWIPTLTDTVYNWGVINTTMQKEQNDSFPYWTSVDFPRVVACRPAIVTICLGTNDSKPWNWVAASPVLYSNDYQAMIDTFSHIATHPKIFACLPTACSNNNTSSVKDSVLLKHIIPCIRTIAATNNIPVIDLHTPFIKYVNYTGTQTQTSFWQNTPPDGIHPQDSGHRILADIFYEAIVNSDDIVMPAGRNGPFKLQFLWYGYAPR